jgi:TetR/AcrR family transcriptional regulator
MIFMPGQVQRKEQRGSRQHERRDASIGALLTATAEILSQGASMEASIHEISRRAGVNAAMIKYYFGNKEGLLLALLERDAEAAMGALDHLVVMDVTAERKLRIHIEGVINTYHRSPYLNRLIHYLMDFGEPTSSERVTEVFIEPMISAYRAIIAQGVAEGTLVDIEPVLLYHTLIGACDHMFHASQSLPKTLGVDTISEDLKRRYVQLVSSIFLKGLRPD